jgi:hypothetical protein
MNGLEVNIGFKVRVKYQTEIMTVGKKRDSKTEVREKNRQR